MSAHTPGPWKVVKTDDHISRPKDFRVDGPTYTANRCCGCSDTGNMVLADARLIAAAPELLEALEALVAEVSGNAARGNPASAYWGSVTAAQNVINKVREP